MHILKNFKNFGEAELDLMRPLTLLIGRNGSGKSNLIEGVELLAQLAHGRPLHEITDVGRGSGSTFELRGGLVGCLKYYHISEYKSDTELVSENDKTKELKGALLLPVRLPEWCRKFSLGFAAVWRKESLEYNITIRINPQPKIAEESLVWGNRVIFHANIGKSEDILDVQYDNFKRGGKKPITHLPSDRSALSRYQSFAHLDNTNSMQKTAWDLVWTVEKYLNAAFVFDPNPKLMRNYERIGQSLLVKDGSNLSSVLQGLQGDDKKKIPLKRILNNLKQFPEEPFENFEFVKTQLGDVLLALKRSDGSLADARLLSDGTLRTLAILTALETVPKGSRIIIEEMDNGIHPSRIKMLVDAIWECGKRRNLNVLATTHNPATLNCLSAEQLEAVVLCHYDQEAKTSRLTPLLDLPKADVLLERGRLGDLVTRQVLDQHLAPNFDEEQKLKAKAWLDSLA